MTGVGSTLRIFPTTFGSQKKPEWKTACIVIRFRALRVLCGVNLDENTFHFPVHIGQPEMPSLELVGQALVVDTQTVQQRRLRVVHVHGRSILVRPSNTLTTAQELQGNVKRSTAGGKSKLKLTTANYGQCKIKPCK